MQSTLISRPGDDPHDVVVVAPDAVRVAPAEDELSSLLHQAARLRSDLQVRAGSSVAAGPAVPEVDTTFRPTAAGEVPDNTWPMARRALRGLMALLLAACIGLAGIAWKAYGDVAKKQIAKWGTQIVLIASLSPDKPALSAQPAAPAAEPVAANAAPPPPAAPAESAAEAAAPAAASPDAAQQLQSMASDLASVSQQVEQLKASVAELKASQQQMSRDLAKASEQNARPRIAALPPRPAVARARKPTPLVPPPQAAVAPPLPQAPAPYQAPVPYYVSRQPDYAPRQAEPQPQTTGESLTDPELSSVPRPPMPVR
jgi:pyruvate/2-oxoglutarate dehydrogenase complex dihydrolipoamide acyltransferase (E2) component